MYTLAQLQAMPVIHQGQYNNLHYEDADTRIWISRLTTADGMPYDYMVTTEKLQNGKWVAISGDGAE